MSRRLPFIEDLAPALQELQQLSGDQVRLPRLPRVVDDIATALAATTMSLADEPANGGPTAKVVSQTTVDRVARKPAIAGSVNRRVGASTAASTVATVKVSLKPAALTDKDIIRLLTNVNNVNYTTEQLQLFRDNPHLQQLQLLGEVPRNDFEFSRILADNDAAQPYEGFVKTLYDRNASKVETGELTPDQLQQLGHYDHNHKFTTSFSGGEFKSVLHWGQRKLLLSEIEFLTRYATHPSGKNSEGGDIREAAPTVDELLAAGGINSNLNFLNYDPAQPTTVVYVGAAPGGHIPYLADMFPDINFHLYDPVEFDIDANEQVQIFQQLFQAADAEKYIGIPNVLLISDIRSVDFSTVTEAEYNAGILRDIQTQQDWYIIMKPYKALFKFRFPYTAGVTEYLDGQVYLQAWAPVASTETRLIPAGFDEAGRALTKAWDHTTYEQQLYFYNNVRRPAYYGHPVQSRQLDNCYDCRCEVHVLETYLRTYGFPFQPVDVDNMSAEITDFLSPSGARDLLSGNIATEKRAAALAKKTNVDNKMAYVAAKDKLAIELARQTIENDNWLAHYAAVTGGAVSNSGSSNNTVNSVILNSIRSLLVKVGNVNFRQVSNWYNLAVYAGEGPKQETYLCYLYYTREIAPSVGFVVDGVKVALAKHKKTLYLLAADVLTGVGNVVSDTDGVSNVVVGVAASSIEGSTAETTRVTGDAESISSSSGNIISGSYYKTDIYIEEFPRQPAAILTLFREVLQSLSQP